MRLRHLTTVLVPVLSLWGTVGAADAQISSQGPLRIGDLQGTITVADLSGGGTYFPGGFQGAPPAGPSLPQYQALAGGAFDGVGRMLMNIGGSTFGCTGALVASQFVLTAAHCVYNSGTASFINGGDVSISFLQDNGTSTPDVVNYTGAEVIGMAGYSGAVVEEQDIALIRLSTDAAAWIPRYELFNGNPMYQQTTMVGFGLTGNGVTGGVISTLFQNPPIRRLAHNSWELTMDESQSVWVRNDLTPETSILISDFDGEAPGGTFPVTGGTFAARTLAQNNTACNIFASTPLPDATRAALCNEGYGQMEGITGSGDSGGPAFVNDGGVWKIAAVTSFGSTRCVPSQASPPQTSPGCAAGFIRNGSFFGSIAGHVAVSYGENYDWVTSNLPPTNVVPEPVSMVLLGTGLLGVAAARRRRREDESVTV